MASGAVTGVNLEGAPPVTTRPHAEIGTLEPDLPPVRVGGRVREPMKLRDAAPVYPDTAVQAGIRGAVILACLLSPQGKVTELKVLRGVPFLDDAAVAAVRQWVYTPPLMDGVPVPVIMTVTVRSDLRR